MLDYLRVHWVNGRTVDLFSAASKQRRPQSRIYLGELVSLGCVDWP
jgi:hypothetical protein